MIALGAEAPAMASATRFAMLVEEIDVIGLAGSHARKARLMLDQVLQIGLASKYVVAIWTACARSSRARPTWRWNAGQATGTYRTRCGWSRTGSRQARYDAAMIGFSGVSGSPTTADGRNRCLANGDVCRASPHAPGLGVALEGRRCVAQNRRGLPRCSLEFWFRRYQAYDFPLSLLLIS